MDLWGIVSFVGLILLGIIIMIIGFFIAYKLYLQRLIGKWTDGWVRTLIEYIPSYGKSIADWVLTPWFASSSFKLHKKEKFVLQEQQGTYSNPSTDGLVSSTGVRGESRNFGSGSACLWNPNFCDRFSSGQLGKYEKPGLHTEQQNKVNDQIEKRSMISQQLQVPMALTIMNNNNKTFTQQKPEDIQKRINDYFQTNFGAKPNTIVSNPTLLPIGSNK